MELRRLAHCWWSRISFWDRVDLLCVLTTCSPDYSVAPKSSLGCELEVEMRYLAETTDALSPTAFYPERPRFIYPGNDFHSYGRFALFVLSVDPTSQPGIKEPL